MADRNQNPPVAGSGSPRRQLERRFDGPIPAEALAGGTLAFALCHARASLVAMTNLARRQIAAVRKARAALGDAPQLPLDAGARRLWHDRLEADLALYLAERRRLGAEVRRLRDLL